MSSQLGRNNSELNNPLKERIKLLMTDEEKEVQQVVNMLEEMRGVRLLTGMDFEQNGITIKGSMELPQKK